ncbi:MAG: hypothetical protein R6W82_05860 [bacterium]
MSHRDEGPVITGPEIRTCLEGLHPGMDPLPAGDGLAVSVKAAL